MPWLDLATEIAEEFAALPSVGRVYRESQLRIIVRHKMPPEYYRDRYRRRTATIVGDPRVCAVCGDEYRINMRHVLHSSGHPLPRVCPKRSCRGSVKARLITAHGASRTVNQWAVFSDLNPETIRDRLRRGWDFARAVLP